MADSESSLNLEQISTSFDDRIQTETAVNGTTVFIQRPKPKDEAGAASVSESAADLPNDFTLSANSTQRYRVSFGPFEVVVIYDANNMSAEILVNLNLPIMSGVKIADVSGNIKNGIEAAISYKELANGKVGVYLHGSSVVLYWDLKGFGGSFKDEIIIFTI